MTLLPFLSDAELAETIDRLNRLLERLDRDPSANAAALGLHYATVLDEAEAELEKRRARLAATASTLQDEG